jgi:transcription elongation factor Elf1
VAALPVNELYDRIIKGLTVPQVPTKEKYKSNRRAECLERILYVCPICGKIQTITSNKNTIKCTNCNLEVEYNKNLEFESKNPNFKFKYVEDWYKYQVDWVKNYQLGSSNDVIFEDDVRLFKVPYKERAFEILVGKIQMSKEKILFISNDLKIDKIEFSIKDITETTVQGKQKLTFYVDNETYQIKGNKGLNTLKYMHMYYHIKKLLGDNEEEFMGM